MFQYVFNSELINKITSHELIISQPETSVYCTFHAMSAIEYLFIECAILFVMYHFMLHSSW